MARSYKTPRCLESFHIPPPEDQLPEGMTRRAALCLYLLIQEGWSERDIAEALNFSRDTVSRDIRAAKRILALRVESAGYPVVEEFFSLWRTGGQREPPRQAAMRHDRFVHDLDQRIVQRSQELADVSECMGADCPVSHARSKGQELTHWERRYMVESGTTSIPDSLFRAKREGHTPARYCDQDPETCTLGCAGCRREL